MSHVSHLYFTDDELLVLAQAATLPPEDLTFIAEDVGRLPGVLTRVALLKLLDNTSPLVREGAIYGLSCGHHRNEPNVRSALERVAMSDPSMAVRACAADVLDE